MNTINQYDAIQERRQYNRFRDLRELYPDLAIPDNTPTLRQLVDRSKLANQPLPATGTPVYTGKDPDLNVPFHIRKDKLAVSNFIKDHIVQTEEDKKTALEAEKKIKAAAAKKKKAEKDQAAADERARIKKIIEDEKEQKK